MSDRQHMQLENKAATEPTKTYRKEMLQYGTSFANLYTKLSPESVLFNTTCLFMILHIWLQ